MRAGRRLVDISDFASRLSRALLSSPRLSPSRATAGCLKCEISTNTESLVRMALRAREGGCNSNRAWRLGSGARQRGSASVPEQAEAIVEQLCNSTNAKRSGAARTSRMASAIPSSLRQIVATTVHRYRSGLRYDPGGRALHE